MTETVLPWRQWVPEFVLLALLWGTSFLFMREGAALADSIQKQARAFKMTGNTVKGGAR